MGFASFSLLIDCILSLLTYYVNRYYRFIFLIFSTNGIRADYR